MDLGEPAMAEQVRHAFVVTSAVNSKFGVYKPHERLEQTLATIDTIRERAPGSKVILMECGGTPLNDAQSAALEKASDTMIDYSNDPDVKAIYVSENWDVVKNTTEIMCFARALQWCEEDGDFNGIDRIHKMSGRYLLNEDFNLDIYEQNRDSIIIGPKFKSQFDIRLTGIELQYMARLWSWPSALTPAVIEVYRSSLDYIAARLKDGGYADIEHVLYKFLPQELVLEIPKLGVEGCIAPNGGPIRN